MTSPRIRRLGIVAAFATALTAITLSVGTAGAAPADRVLLTLDSRPGDYVGQGEFLQYTPDDGTFTVTSTGHEVNVSFSGTEPGVFWRLRFDAPDGETLIRGPYEDATRAAFSSPTKPGLDVGGNGRGCNMLTGRFDVNEVALNSDGSVARLAISFEQHCDGSAAPLFGEVLYHADQPFDPPVDTDGDDVPDTVDNCDAVSNPTQGNADRDLLGDACDSYFDNTNLTFDSDPGDWIGQGVEQTWYLEDGHFTGSGSPTTVLVRFDGGSTTWRLNFDAPDGMILAPGTYESATRYPFNAFDEPGLDVSGSGRGCNTLTGSFTIHQVVWTGDGSLERFSAEFIQYCGNTNAALRGIVNYNASWATPIAHAGLDITVEAVGPTTEVTLDGSGSSDPDGEPLTFTWFGNFDGGTATGVTPTVTFSGLGAYPVDLEVSDGQASATDRVIITIVDTTAPYAGAALTPQGKFNRKGGSVAVTASCADAVDPSPATAADINGVTVEDGQVVKLSPSSTYGSSVSRKGELTISGPDATLTVTCVDDAGNGSTASDSIDM